MPRQRKRIEHPERKRLRKSAMVVDRAGIGIASAGLILQTTGAVALGAPPSPPADGGLNNSTVSFWLDETRNNLKVTRFRSVSHQRECGCLYCAIAVLHEKRTGADAPVAGGTPALPSRRPATSLDSKSKSGRTLARLDRGRESVSAPPPSEPDVRISRIRLSS